MRIVLLILIASLCLACATPKKENPYQLEQFELELDQLKNYFQIPGMAVLVENGNGVVYENYFGVANLESQEPIDSNTLFPIASITKVYAATRLFQLVEEGRLSLGQSLSDFIVTSYPDSILVKHVLSHTSQGELGKHFYYSSRFSHLTQVIEAAGRASFEEQMQKNLFDPLGLEHTHLLKDSAQLANSNWNLASPYLFEGSLSSGFIDFGYSASAGIVSNARDLASFCQALEEGSLLSEASQKQMQQEFYPDAPYGMGMFCQKVEGVQLYWSYGQYDCYSSLYLNIPSKKLRLILLANNNLMSDPARLIYGDIRYSLFAMCFLKNFLFHDESAPITEEAENIDGKLLAQSTFYRDQLLAQALAESFLARGNSARANESARILEMVFENYPEVENYPTLSLLHNLSFLNTIAFHYDLPPFYQFDDQVLRIGTKLLTKDAQNPYANLYMGNHYLSKGDTVTAKKHFQTILSTPNFTRRWYHQEAKNQLLNITVNKASNREEE